MPGKRIPNVLQGNSFRPEGEKRRDSDAKLVRYHYKAGEYRCFNFNNFQVNNPGIALGILLVYFSRDNRETS